VLAILDWTEAAQWPIQWVPYAIFHCLLNTRNTLFGFFQVQINVLGFVYSPYKFATNHKHKRRFDALNFWKVFE